MPAELAPVRTALGKRRLLVALVLTLLVPGALGVAALTYTAPEPAPASTAPQHTPLPQVPDSVALAQLDRSAAVTRVARKLTTPQLLTPARAGTAQLSTLPTLALAPRSTPYTLAELRALAPAAFSTVPVAPGALLLDAHIEVPVGATLVIDSRTPDVRLSSDPSAFATVISRGTTSIAGTAETPVRISTWDPQEQVPDSVSTDGRSFVLQIGGRMDVDHGQFEYLGFGTGTSSGVAWRGAAPDVAGTAPESGRVKAQGTVTNSVFAHNHFGAYTHEAQGMGWSGNTFSDNEEYGFDPHDFSDDFVVENNVASRNGKHGFIFSRGCMRNVLRDNTAFGNAGHGFMIDDGRSVASETAEARIDPSNDNLVTGNVAHDNAGSGVEIEGGTGTVVSDNHLSRNDIGVRIKSGATVSVTGNVIDDSVRYGVHVLDPAARAAIDGNHISGSWAAINLAAASSAALGENPSTDVSTPLVIDGVAQRDPSWVDRAAQFLHWNPVLVLWVLILVVPLLVGLLFGLSRVLRAPLRLIRRRAATA
jgi:parallel beta-helix repeat protein